AFVEVEPSINPYLQRHLSIFQWLRGNPDVGLVWCVDGTGVQMLRDPFPQMRRGVLYLGSEPTTLRNEWMLANHPDHKIQNFFKANPNLQLLNAGLIGGDCETGMAFFQSNTKQLLDNSTSWID